MTYTYDQLHKMTVLELRDLAKGIEHETVKGYTQMNKEHLLPAICKALNIDTHAHHAAVGINKAAVKQRLHSLKSERDKALEVHDHKQLRVLRRTMHSLRRRIRAAAK